MPLISHNGVRLMAAEVFHCIEIVDIDVDLLIV